MTNDYPEAVGQIAADYLERVKAQLRRVPLSEQNDFLQEIRSHIYEAFHQVSASDEVARMLAVLRNLGEPSEVVSERLPGLMMRAGTARKLPLYIVGGILVALFGIPLGFGGMGVLVGLLAALAGLVFAYYAVTGSVLLTGAIFALAGLARLYEPVWWDKMVLLGYIHDDFGDFFEQLSPSGQAFLMLLFAAVFIACGVGLLWLGKYLLRGLRFLFLTVFDWTRRLIRTVRGKLGNRQGRYSQSQPSFAGMRRQAR